MRHILHVSKRFSAVIALIVLLALPGKGWAQPWTYDFGTGTGTHPTNTSSTTFLTSTPANGGTYRVRTGSAGGTMVLSNPGTSLGIATELQINAATSTSANKFGVYNWTAPSTVAYLKFKYRTTSIGNGNLNISLGNSTIGTDNQGYTSQYGNSITSLTITYASGAISSVVRRNSGGNTTISGSGLAKDTDQIIEIYANNGSGSVNYTKGVSNSLATRTWDLWVDGTKVVTNAATAGTLASGNLSGFAFFAESSTSNVAWTYIDDLEYSNILPAGASAPTVTTQAISSLGTTTATGNGNITSTGGVDPTVRGFCYDIATNPDPDITDPKVEETGTFATGAFTGSITGLTAGTQYKVRAYATNTLGTGYGSVVTFNTLSAEPSGHAASFTAAAVSQTQIDLTFSAASTIPASGYLILQRTSAAPTGAPVDATGYTVGNAIGDGTVAAIISSSSATSASITGLTAGTSYYFTLFPYNWDGSNALTYNYKTDGSVPGAIATTTAALDATSEVSGPAVGSQPDPMIISSLADTDGEALRVFDMDVYDYGTDGQPTKITQVTVKPGTNNTASWVSAIQGVKLSVDGGSTFVTIGAPAITATSIVIPVTSGNLNIADTDAATVSLYIYLKTSGLADNTILEFKVDGASHGFTADATGSTLLATFSTAPVSNEMLIDVVATKLAFIQQPSGTLVNATMAPAVTIEATDANNNRDLDASGLVSLISSGTMTGPVTASLSFGFGTFGNIVHPTTGNSLTLTASFSGLADGVSSSFSVLSALAAGDILFIGYGTDDPDKFAFLVMNNIPDGTQIIFTDNAWTETVLLSNENTGVYTVPSGGLIKGAIVHIQGTSVTGGGSMSADLSGLAAAGDQILAYQGSSASPSFIAGVSSTGWISSGSVSNNTSYLPAPLAVYATAVSFASEEDNGYYSGPTTLANGAAASLICNSANWTRSGTSQTFPSWLFAIGNHTAIAITATAQNLTINTNETLTIDATKTLTVLGDLLIKSDATGTGSLIDNGTLTSPNSTVQHYITGAASAWHLLSSPVAGQAISGDFTPIGGYPDGSGYDTYAWDEPTETWMNQKVAENDIDAFVPGEGYLVAYEVENPTKTFAGALNTGIFLTPVTVSGTGDYSKSNLVGNPYPSSIDWKSVTGIDKSDLAIDGGGRNMYIYNQTSNNYGVYNDALPGDAGTNGTSRYIAPMQGFFVIAANAGDFGLDNDARVHNTQAWLKSGNDNSLRLSVTAPAGLGSDEMLLDFGHATSVGGAEKWNSFVATAPALSTPKDGENYSISFLTSVSDNPMVPVAFKAGVDGSYSITADFNTAAFSSVTLLDIQTGSTQNMKVNPVYTFVAATADDANRFTLHFSPVGIDTPTSGEAIHVYAANGNIYLSMLNHADAQVKVYNLTGQLMLLGNASDNELTELNANSLSNGVYIVTVTDGSQVVSHKVIIRK